MRRWTVSWYERRDGLPEKLGDDRPLRSTRQDHGRADYDLARGICRVDKK
jgi:hypothetical protein